MPPPESAPKPAAPTSFIERHILGVRYADVPRLLPGIATAALVVVWAGFAAGWLGRGVQALQGVRPDPSRNPVSSIVVCVLTGLIVANTVGVPRLLLPGLDFCMKRLLRLGIICVGIKLSLPDLLNLGRVGIPVVISVIVLALLFTTWLARRLGVPGNMGTLAAASTSICGITATLTVGATIEADDREIAYTVTNVTIFGMLAMFLYPWIAHAVFPGAPRAAGLFLGTAIHDTSQVMAAAFTYADVFRADEALKMATVTKLARNACLAAVVPLLGYLHWRRHGKAGQKVPFSKLFPVFIIGFIALAVIRSIGDAGIVPASPGHPASGAAFGRWDPAQWTAAVKLIGDTFVHNLLGAAMAGVGLSTNLRTLKGLGLKPMILGAVAALVVGLLGCGLAAFAG